ncbi:hypothetical protein TTSV1_gp36 [Thermoproteus tenax spherical virus 1]|uniref:Uncharacterized protein n=1 Tax=Thermoproteus tenax spherical virus 1 TaxID=292639 RepID=Q647C6_9VIRU|nr:hypothetical protein TTSV1_gp36 [Thermoproteus tenax spherical virus 1]AAU25986.1 hypothetical protein [Thermoproteus tenax spherical virus 1]
MMEIVVFLALMMALAIAMAYAYYWWVYVVVKRATHDDYVAHAVALYQFTEYLAGNQRRLYDDD